MLDLCFIDKQGYTLLFQSDEEEEMPPEAKMRMKNVGRQVPIELCSVKV